MKNFGEDNRQYDPRRGQYRLAWEFLRRISPRKGAKILDVGAGMGEFASDLKENGYEVTCIEGSDHCYEDLVARGFDAHNVDLENEKFPFADNSFDIVISLEVIEHLWNIDHYLSEIRRVLKPGGRFICTTPNYNHWRYRLLSLFGRFESFTYGSRHKKFYTSKSFPDELRKYFTVQEIKGYGWVPKLHIHFTNKLGMNLFSVTQGVICRKK